MDTITPAQLLERYDTFLIDAYGVLVTSSGVVPGAPGLLRRLDDEDKRWSVVTNDASRLPETCAAQFSEMLGHPVEQGRVVTSGSMLSRWVVDEGLAGAEAFVLGPDDSRIYAKRAGLELSEPELARVFVVGDESGFDFLPVMDRVLSAIIRKVEAGDDVDLVCPNADRIYPKGDGGFGFAAGAMADMLVSGLNARFPDKSFEFRHLGKPDPDMFHQGYEVAEGRGEVVVLGDTPATDVVGANAAGYDVVLFGDATPDAQKEAEAPTWRLRSW